jgi:ATP-dependent Clp protease ATP-binding subunit ClpA
MTPLTQDIQLTDTLRNAVKIAQSIAREHQNPEFSAPHLLQALLHPDTGLLTLLKQLGTDIYYLEEWAEVRMEALEKAKLTDRQITGDAGIQSIFAEADHMRLVLSQEAIGPAHALAALSTAGVAFTYDQLKSYPLRGEQIMHHLMEQDETRSAIMPSPVKAGPDTTASPSSHALEKYCIDKTRQAKEGRLDSITGREKEIRMMSEILCRRSKPNVLLIGEPGVGKSALVDGFTLFLQSANPPPYLRQACLFELDMGALVAGASYKGEVEDRLKSILRDLRRFDRAILFIDEVHVLLDRQGPAVGSANFLKPELARGELTVIGATTREEYRKFIEPDEAFNRRFEILAVEEPDLETCFHMIQTVVPYYEKHHGITAASHTLREAIRLAKRYIRDRRLPDAALDLTDRSMAALRMMNNISCKDISEIRSRFEQWCRDDQEETKHSLEDWKWFCVQTKRHISPILQSYITTEEDPAQMTEPSNICAYLTTVLGILEKAASAERLHLEAPDIAAIVSYKTGIPIGKVQTQEKERLLNMEPMLRRRVLGQDHAIRSVSEAILESRSGLCKPGQPIGSFFFLGPTGTGKTELAKSLAEFLFQDESFMIRFDMSEFKEEHSAALLYGAPPGYVGYEEGGLLVNKIRQQPYSVVLFDEIEKAHVSVFDIFLQILDEGRLHDKLGKEGDFSNAVIIFTSNLGSQQIAEQFESGNRPSSESLLETMSGHFRPEFLARITEIVPFAPIDRNMLHGIVAIQLRSLLQLLQQQGISLVVTDGAMEQLISTGFNPKYGARPLAGVIRNQLRRPLSRKIISGELSPGDAVELAVDAEENFIWKITKGGNKY